MSPQSAFLGNSSVNFNKKALICLIVEQIGPSALLKIKLRIRINLATLLNLVYFMGITLFVYGGEGILSQNKIEDLFGD